MSAGSWGCPHEHDDHCEKVNGAPCEPGMKGCVLAGRFAFFDESKNERLRRKAASREARTDNTPAQDKTA